MALDKKLREFTMQDVRQATTNGRIRFVFDGKVYDATSWEWKHPGGDLVLRHMSGRDATQQITAYHPAHVLKDVLPRFCIGTLVEKEQRELADNQLNISFTHLVDECRRDGLFDTKYSFFVKKIVLFATLWCLVMTLAHTMSAGWSLTLMSTAIIAFIWHQVAFLAHDAGHNGITHERHLDHGLGVILASFVGGLSIAWWKASHNVHHIITNDPEHDPDIQHLPFFAACTRFKDNLWSTFYRRRMCFNAASRFIVRFQSMLYYPILLFGRFNLYANSIRHIAFERNVPFRKLEMVGMIFFWSWYLWLASCVAQAGFTQLLVFVFFGHALTFLLHVQITLSHYSMSCETMSENEEFVRHQLRTTLDVDCPTWLDWFHGGLQFQVEHHLFPRMPRHHLRAASEKVRRFCKEHNLTYHLYTFTEGNMKTLRHLQHVADQLKFLYKVAVSESRGASIAS